MTKKLILTILLFFGLASSKSQACDKIPQFVKIAGGTLVISKIIDEISKKNPNHLAAKIAKALLVYIPNGGIAVSGALALLSNLFAESFMPLSDTMYHVIPEAIEDDEAVRRTEELKAMLRILSGVAVVYAAYKKII